MEKPSLVIMAAGMGSRYGGLKQIDEVGPNGETIIEYSVYDAIKAGFEKIVFIINDEIKEVFKSKIGSKVESYIKTKYVYQRIDDLPEGYRKPSDRIKPWGTGHAVLSCMNVVNEPFAVINADDFYGAESFKLMYDFLKNTKDDSKYHFCMLGYLIENTLTENGFVSRGICNINNGHLHDVIERTHIENIDNKPMYEEDDKYFEISQKSIVSMNFWGFSKSIFNELYNHFVLFLENNKDNMIKAEFFLPSVVNELIRDDKTDVQVLNTCDNWYGVTYKNDKENVVKSIKKMIIEGKYPERLWRNG